ncbi:SpaA isopeptide-forming pilin-related protein [Ilumatobacter fluminis]|uniref:SpaA isopeptide-forming pilin-related protein n=1 Tax=Ilumatobacter fluminis TaxID=467091 RepID=UPI001060356F|nr:SpaA isopeptide-forming pilin-related protein [Ilumatobacter fluminis]
MSLAPRPRPIAAAASIASVALVAICSLLVVAGERAAAATVIASYEHGRADVIINGYGTQAMGTFRLRDGDETHIALCLEADVAHSTADGAYEPVEATVASARLDALLWWLDRQPSIDDDTAVAASALAWFYAGARRSIGPPVWADGTRGFAAITPATPEPWDSLAPFSMSHPIGLVAGGTHLDEAERRVAELHWLADRLAGEWHLDVEAGASGATARLAIDGSPFAGHPVDLSVTTVGGAPLPTRTVLTDPQGRVSLPIPEASDGYVVTVSTVAPGLHREWDGAGSIQRLATPTERTVSASAERRPDDGHLVVRKRSADPTIGVEGAVFDLIDADGAVVATARTDVDGIARFTGIDRAAHRRPFTIVETAAPPGLVASAVPVVVDRLGTDPDDPPVIEITNDPATVTLVVRKTLSVDAAGPPDRSGFEFIVRRRTDGAEHVVVTAADGVAAPLALPLGTYDVCESDVPAWATGLTDTGCRTVDLTLDALGTTIEIGYVNEVPEPGIDTRATDPTDGDQVIEQHQTEIVDRVRLDRLVPGTTYRIRGDVVDAEQGTPTRFVGWAEFTADGTDATIDVPITVEGLSVGDWVVTEEVFVGDVLVARHADLLDADQTVAVVAPATTTSVAPSTSVAPVTTTTTTTTTATTTTTTTTTTAVPVESTPPTSVVAPPRVTLPPTGGDAVATALRLGDVGFVVGVGLFAVAGLTPARRRSERDEAGR